MTEFANGNPLSLRGIPARDLLTDFTDAPRGNTGSAEGWK